jgi:hypothetical protein
VESGREETESDVGVAVAVAVAVAVSGREGVDAVEGEQWMKQGTRPAGTEVELFVCLSWLVGACSGDGMEWRGGASCGSVCNCDGNGCACVRACVLACARSMALRG